MVNRARPGGVRGRLRSRIQRRGVRPRDAAYLIVSVWLFFIVVFAVVEHLVDSKTFGTVWEGMWWGTQTVTTVGYGDVVPSDTAGKAIAVVLMLGGLSLIAVITGVITSAFVARAEAERREAGEDPVMTRLDELSAQLDQLKGELSASQRGRPR